jgi:DNA-directed RNA polymerase subunit M/transcription elongation factor TFIIS
MLYLKGCPRCHGDLYLDRDSHGTFRQCLQCGWIQDVQEKVLVTAVRPAPAATRTATLAPTGGSKHAKAIA